MEKQNTGHPVHGDETGLRLLLIDGHLAYAKVVREALADSRDGPFEVEWVTRLSDGLERVGRSGIRAVLLNMFLSDSKGIPTFEKLHQAAPQIPILILSAIS